MTEYARTHSERTAARRMYAAKVGFIRLYGQQNTAATYEEAEELWVAMLNADECEPLDTWLGVITSVVDAYLYSE